MAPGSSVAAPAGSETRLDALLQSLYDLGETEDETGQKRSKKKRESQKREVGAAAAATRGPPPPGTLRRGQKSTSSFFEDLRVELQCTPAASPSSPPRPAAAELPPPGVEVVEFHSRSRKRKPKPARDAHTESKTSIHEKNVHIQEFDLEKARLEVHRFGIAGYGKGKERALEQERAILLGAKPPKNSCVNYKVLQAQIKEKKAAKEEEKRVAQDAEIFKKKWKGQEDRKPKKKKSAPSILSNGRSGQVGKFKNGTLILSAVDIKRIKSSRVAK